MILIIINYNNYQLQQLKKVISANDLAVFSKYCVDFG